MCQIVIREKKQIILQKKSIILECPIPICIHSTLPRALFTRRRSSSTTVVLVLPAFGTVFQTCILSLSTFFLPFSVPPLHTERNKDREREKEKERGPGMVGTQSVKTAENNGIYHLILIKT